MHRHKIHRRLLLAAPLFAGVLLSQEAFAAGEIEIESDVDSILAVMAATSENDYIAARSSIVDLGAHALLVLEKRRRAIKFSERTWKEDIVVDAALSWIKQPDAANRAYQLEGVDPTHYLKRRRPEPEVTRELRRLKVVSPILFELELKTRLVYPFASREAYPSTFGEAALRELRDREALALRTGLLAAIAGSNHPAAPHLLREIVLNRQEDVRVRRVAAIGLGQTAAFGVAPLLAMLADDANEPDPVRIGAIAGLGHARGIASLEALSRIARREGSEHMRRVAVASIGTLANAWVLKNHRVEARDQLRDRASRVLIDLLVSSESEEPTEGIIESMVMIANPTLRDLLHEISHDTARPDSARSRANRAIERLDIAQNRESAISL